VLTELSSVSQLWTTGYGRILLVKTAVFSLLLALAWLARRRLLLAQLAMLVGLAVAVGVLTDSRPGRARASAVETTQSNVPPPAPAPPPGAFVDAARAGKLAVGFAWARGKPTVTLVGPDGGAVTNVPVDVKSSGRTFHVTVAGTSLRFVVPATLKPAAALLHRATRVYDSLSSVTIFERLSSAPGIAQRSIYYEQAPNRLEYDIVSATQPNVAGTKGIVIGSRRWDRPPGGAWQPSSQTPFRVPQTYWSSQARNAYIVAPGVLTFYDPQIRAWFRLRVDPTTARPINLTMIGASHFMRHRYSVGSPAISAPPSR
jgi:hypothetical protein